MESDNDVALLDNKPVLPIDFFVEYLTRGEHGKELTHRSDTEATFTCPGCGNRVVVRTFGLVSPAAAQVVTDGTTLEITLSTLPEFTVTFTAAERAWTWLNS